MSSPPEPIQIVRPDRGHTYEDWWRPSINLRLDNFDDEYLEKAITSTCPVCGFKVRYEVLVVRRDGIWHFGNEDK